jgi:hypothetical protein
MHGRDGRSRVVTVIATVAWIAISIGAVLVLAIVVGIVDAVNAPMRRQVAQERRERWESRYAAYPAGSDE